MKRIFISYSTNASSLSYSTKKNHASDDQIFLIEKNNEMPSKQDEIIPLRIQCWEVNKLNNYFTAPA